MDESSEVADALSYHITGENRKCATLRKSTKASGDNYAGGFYDQDTQLILIKPCRFQIGKESRYPDKEGSRKTAEAAPSFIDNT
ncbi:MAG TPA: hypothetical protein PLF62_10920 [Clostridia bacterium]|jgi:hypothetical protein|nr:hypothetical protein [Clostridia bacterium]